MLGPKTRPRIWVIMLATWGMPESLCEANTESEVKEKNQGKCVLPLVVGSLEDKNQLGLSLVHLSIVCLKDVLVGD